MSTSASTLHLADIDGRAAWHGQAWTPTSLGIDTVYLPGIQASLTTFGERFECRLYTEQERRDCGQDPVLRIAHLGARFAAKEAAIKAFDLASIGVNWRELEVVRGPQGAPILRVHGRALTHLKGRGIARWALSLSHDGDHAVAVVAAVYPVSLLQPEPTP